MTIESVLDSLRRAPIDKKKKMISNQLPVMTTDQWRQYKMEQAKKKEETEGRKVESRKIRELKKVKKEKQLAEKQTKREAKRKMANSIKKKPQLLKRKKIPESHPDEQAEMLEEEIFDDPSPVANLESTEKVQDERIIVGDWVIVQYDGNKYPGTVSAYDETNDEFEVTVMYPFQYKQKQYWRWPQREDKIFYPANDVTKYSTEPRKLESKGRGEGLFEFEI